MAAYSETQRIAQLTPVSAVFARIDALVRPVSPREADVGLALDRILAEDVVAPAGRPARGIALRDGWAVSSDALADASSYTPMPLSAVPARVEVGEALPAAADAVAPFEAVIVRDGRAEAIAPVTPGEGALPAQADAIVGAPLRPAGERLRAIDLAILGALGVARVNIREPRLRLTRAGPRGDVIDAAYALIAGAVERAGAVVIGDPPAGAENSLEAALRHEAADAVVAIGGTGSGRRDASVSTLARAGRMEIHGIALAPGETAAFGFVGARPVLLMPGRLDAALAVWLVIGRRLLARLAGHAEADATVTVELTRKISSTVGMTEVVPVRRRGDAVEALASGYFPLHALAKADGWILVPAESEGFPAGAKVVLRPLP
jgi:molybdopterin molybdotransferase